MTKSSETIRSIQREYAELLDAHFGGLGAEFDDALKAEGATLLTDRAKRQEFIVNYIKRHADSTPASPLILPRHLHKAPKPVFLTQIEELLNAIGSFWDSNYHSLKNSITDSDQLFTLIGDLNGETWYYPECAIRLGLYFDGVCLVDPLSVVAQRLSAGDIGLDEFLTNKGALLAVIDNYLQMRYLKPLYTSPTDVPVGIAVPATCVKWQGADFHSLRNLAEATACGIFSESLDRDIADHRGLLEIAERTSPEQFCERLNEQEVVAEFLGSHQLSDVRQLQTGAASTPQFDEFIRTRSGAVQFLFPLFGLLQGGFLALDGAELLANDYKIDFAQPRHHWIANKYRIRMHANFASVRIPEFVVTQNALLSKETEFLLAATMRDLIEWRKEGIMEGVRELYRVQAVALQRSSMEDLEKLSREVVEALHMRIGEDVASLKREKALAIAAANDSRRNLFTNAVFGVVSNLFSQPAGLLVTLAGSVVPTDTIPQFLSTKAAIKKSSSDSNVSPSMHMHALMNRASMELAVSGSIEVKI